MSLQIIHFWTIQATICQKAIIEYFANVNLIHRSLEQSKSNQNQNWGTTANQCQRQLIDKN